MGQEVCHSPVHLATCIQDEVGVYVRLENRVRTLQRDCLAHSPQRPRYMAGGVGVVRYFREIRTF